MVVRMGNSSLFFLIWSVGADQWPNEQTDIDQVMWLGSTWFLSQEQFSVGDSNCFVCLLQFFYFSLSSLHRICKYEDCIFLFTPCVVNLGFLSSVFTVEVNQFETTENSRHVCNLKVVHNHQLTQFWLFEDRIMLSTG